LVAVPSFSAASRVALADQDVLVRGTASRRDTARPGSDDALKPSVDH
jgi:hypothetical protein